MAHSALGVEDRSELSSEMATPMPLWEVPPGLIISYVTILMEIGYGINAGV